MSTLANMDMERLCSGQRSGVVPLPVFWEHYMYWLSVRLDLRENMWLFRKLDSYEYIHATEVMDAGYGSPFDMRGIFSADTGFEFAGMPEPSAWAEKLDEDWDGVHGIIESEGFSVRLYSASALEAIAWLAEIAWETETSESWGAEWWGRRLLENMRLSPLPNPQTEPGSYDHDRDVITFGRRRETRDELERRVDGIIRRWLGRKYTRYGVGGPFPIRPDESVRDRREMEDWQQATYYVRHPEMRRHYHA